MTMHYLPLTVFRSKNHRNPQSEWGDILASAKLSLLRLQQHNVGKLRSDVLLYGLDATVLTIPELRCGTLNGLSDLLLSTHGRAKGVSEAYVLPMGEELLRRFGVSFQELTRR